MEQETLLHLDTQHQQGSNVLLNKVKNIINVMKNQYKDEKPVTQ